MGLIYQLFHGLPAADLNTTGVKLIVPVCESLKIVEYGFISTTTDPGSTGVLKLQYLDGAAAAEAARTFDLHSFTVPAAAAEGDIVSQRVDVLVDKLLNKYLVSTLSTPGTLTDEPDGFVAVQLNVTTAFGAGVTGTVYMKAAMCGTQKGPATSQTLVSVV